jgi:TatD DNase family protein
VIDFHCHIDLYPDPASVLREAENAGIYVLAVTTTPRAWEGTRKLIGTSRRIRTAVGLHPELIADRHTEVALLAALLPQTRYVGEVGLDGSPHLRGSFHLQDAAFRQILRECAALGGRVLSIHSRRAAAGVLDGLQSEPGCGAPILHWFTGSPRELDRAIGLGCWSSVGPLMLSTANGRRLTEMMPRDRLLTETDAPFAQRGGVPLMPWDVSGAVAQLADIWGEDAEVTEVRLHDNLRRLTATETRSDLGGR